MDISEVQGVWTGTVALLSLGTGGGIGALWRAYYTTKSRVGAVETATASNGAQVESCATRADETHTAVEVLAAKTEGLEATINARIGGLEGTIAGIAEGQKEVRRYMQDCNGRCGHKPSGG